MDARVLGLVLVVLVLVAPTSAASAAAPGSAGGDRGLAVAAERVVAAVERLVAARGLGDDPVIQELLGRAREIAGEIEGYVEAGNMSAAHAAYIELAKVLREIIIRATRQAGAGASAETRKLLVKIRVLETILDNLEHAATRLPDSAAAARLNETISAVKAMLGEAVKLLRAGNTSAAAEIVREAVYKVKEIRKQLMEKISEYARKRATEVAEHIAQRLREKADELEKEGHKKLAEMLRKIADLIEEKAKILPPKQLAHFLHSILKSHVYRPNR